MYPLEETSDHTEKSNPRYVYAIIRVDDYLGSSVPVDRRFSIKEVIEDPSEAKREVERLNSLRKDDGVHYFSQITKLRVKDLHPA